MLFEVFDGINQPTQQVGRSTNDSAHIHILRGINARVSVRSTNILPLAHEDEDGNEFGLT